MPQAWPPKQRGIGQVGSGRVGPGELDSRQYRPVSSEYAFLRANRHEYLSGMTGC